MSNIYKYQDYIKTKFLFFWTMYYKCIVIWKLIFSKQFIFIGLKIKDKYTSEASVNRFQLSELDSGKLMESLGKEYREFGEYSESIQNLKL